jgi:hypothetical protein
MSDESRAQSRHTGSKRSGIKASAKGTRMSNPRLLPLKDAAEHIGLSVWALRERIWAGQIPVVQFDNPNGGKNRKMYIDSEDIEALISKNKRTIR